MDPWKELVKRWPSVNSLALDIKVKELTVRKWIHRKHIPSRYWGKLIRAARKRRIPLRPMELIDLSEQR